MPGDHGERPAGNGQAEDLPTVGASAFSFPQLLPYLPEGVDVATALNKPRPAQGEDAYRVLVGHTYQCTTCGRGAYCADAVRLNRAWRAVRR